MATVGAPLYQGSALPFFRLVGKLEIFSDLKVLENATLEAVSIQFIPENGGGVGVRLKKQTRAE